MNTPAQIHSRINIGRTIKSKNVTGANFQSMPDSTNTYSMTDNNNRHQSEQSLHKCDITLSDGEGVGATQARVAGPGNLPFNSRTSQQSNRNRLHSSESQ